MELESVRLLGFLYDNWASLARVALIVIAATIALRGIHLLMPRLREAITRHNGSRRFPALFAMC